MPETVFPQASDRERPAAGAAVEDSQSEVCLTEVKYRQLISHLFGDPSVEQHAFLLARCLETAHGRRYLVREMCLTPMAALEQQSSSYLRLDPNYYLPIIDRCMREDLALLEVHSHTGADHPVRFSPVDIRNEREKIRWFAERYPTIRTAALVLTTASFDGHEYRGAQRRPLGGLRILDRVSTFVPAASAAAPPVLVDYAMYHRQVLALGEEGQRRLCRCRIGLVGLGGLGSCMTQLCAYSGIRRFVLIDPDRVEQTNLNRLVGAAATDVARLKVDVAARMIRTIHPDAEVETVPTAAEDPQARRMLQDVDLVIGCTDAHGARLTLNVLCAEYLLPLLDLGTGIQVAQDAITAIGGQMFFVVPGVTACLHCLGVINSMQARIDHQAPAERRDHLARGYGLGTPQPSVLFLNSTLASMAMGELLKWLTGYRTPAGLATVDLLQPAAQPIAMPPRNPGCAVCGEEGRLAWGDSREAPLARCAIPPVTLAGNSPITYSGKGGNSR